MNDIKEILSKYKKIAMVGVSNDPTKASTIVMKYMQKYGFKVYPVNPKAKGQKCDRCWHYQNLTVKGIEDTKLCERCANIINNAFKSTK